LKVSDRVGDLGEFLKEQRETARLSLRQLASVAGVSNPYLSQIERGLRKPSAEVLQQIAKGLQISAEVLFLRAGLLEESNGLEVEAAIQSDTALTARQKRVLLDIYATFRAENGRTTASADPAEVAEAVQAATATVEVVRVVEAEPEPATEPATKPATEPATKPAPKKRAARKRTAKKSSGGSAASG
jgi:transcriptional regulator with XRE-family HTH domain